MKNNFTHYFPMQIEKNNIQVKENIITDEYGEQTDALAICASREEKNSLIFDTNISLHHSKDKKQNILTELLNIKDIPDLTTFFKNYGFWISPPDNYWYSYNQKDILDTLKTLQNIIKIEAEIKKQDCNYQYLFESYLDLVLNGKIKVEGYCNDSRLDDSLDIQLTEWAAMLPNTWGGTFSYINYKLSAYEDVVDDEIVYPEKFFDTLLDKEIITKDINCPYNETTTDDIPLEFIINYYYNYVTLMTSSVDTDALCLFQYIYANQHFKSFNSIDTSKFDELTKNKIKEFSDNLANAYIKSFFSLKTKLNDNNELTTYLTTSLEAIVVALKTIDFSSYCFDICKKPDCNNIFIRSYNKTNSCYCCSAHARSEAQAAFRKRQKIK